MIARPRLWLTPLHRAESSHAIAQLVFQRKLSPDDALELERKLDRHRAAGVWVEVPFPENAWETCSDLARRHGQRLGTRTLDALHVASALELKAERFWTFDDRQAKLAVAAGLKTARRRLTNARGGSGRADADA